MKSTPIKCTATTQAGRACRAWSVRGTDPPRCGAHGAGKTPPGAPENNTNAVKHGYYQNQTHEAPCTITEIIADLSHRQRQLSAFIDKCLDANHIPPTDDLAVLLSLHGQNASRLGRLLRDQRALSGETSDGLAGAIDQALSELSSEIQVPL